jgi:tetratricopeptide (TPR) repeat protein
MIEETPREASYLLARLLQQNPDSVFICVNAALANEKLGNYNKAIDYYLKAINIEPNNSNHYYNLAILYDKTKQYIQAIDYYNLTVKNYNNDSAISISEVQNRLTNLKTLI